MRVYVLEEWFSFLQESWQTWRVYAGAVLVATLLTLYVRFILNNVSPACILYSNDHITPIGSSNFIVINEVKWQSHEQTILGLPWLPTSYVHTVQSWFYLHFVILDCKHLALNYFSMNWMYTWLVRAKVDTLEQLIRCLMGKLGRNKKTAHYSLVEFLKVICSGCMCVYLFVCVVACALRRHIL